jgi:hypothetical protein
MKPVLSIAQIRSKSTEINEISLFNWPEAKPKTISEG